MKRTLSISICIIFLCSLLLVGIVKAGNPAFSIIEYPAITTCTVDGKWTNDAEWSDTEHVAITGNGTGTFGYNIQDFTNLGLEWIVEFYSDNTNDPGDYWQICLDSDNSGGAAPQVGDFMIQITGHTTLTLYQGTGTGWTVVAPAAGELTWANTITWSPLNPTPHWILEIVDSSKSSGTIQTGQPPNGMRIAAYDASTNKFASWAPSSSANIPDQWGVISEFSQSTVPENIGLTVVLLASSVALLAGCYYSRKRLKTTTP